VRREVVHKKAVGEEVGEVVDYWATLKGSLNITNIIPLKKMRKCK
jgi:hypothetical protein